MTNSQSHPQPTSSTTNLIHNKRHPQPNLPRFLFRQKTALMLRHSYQRRPKTDQSAKPAFAYSWVLRERPRTARRLPRTFRWGVARSLFSARWAGGLKCWWSQNSLSQGWNRTLQNSRGQSQREHFELVQDTNKTSRRTHTQRLCNETKSYIKFYLPMSLNGSRDILSASSFNVFFIRNFVTPW